MLMPQARVGFAEYVPVQPTSEVLLKREKLKGDIVQIFGRISERTNNYFVLDHSISFTLSEEVLQAHQLEVGEQILVRGILHESMWTRKGPRLSLKYSCYNLYNYLGHETEIRKIDPLWTPRFKLPVIHFQ
jgi:hypothetical protein